MKYGRLASITLAAALLLVSSSCLTPPSPPSPEVSQQMQSDKQRITSPVINQADMSTLVENNNEFALNAYQSLKNDSNLFLSPYSISLALAMTYAGAREATAQQMADTLHFTLPQDRLHTVFNSLDLELHQRGSGAKGKDGKGFKLNIVNAIWGQKDFTFLQEFLDTLAQNYGAGIRLLDFRNAPEPSRITINNWVSDQTEGRIKDLISPNAIDPMTRLVLTNAIYFNAAWKYAFNKQQTSNDDFHLLSGSAVSVPMMHQTEHFRYSEGDGYQAVELPYDGDELSMIVVLPHSGQFDSFSDSLNANKLAGIVQALAFKKVALAMPIYEFTSSFSLNQTLRKMGMPLAFTPPASVGCSDQYANFSGMDGKCDLYISDVIHKAFISVDETGTEAAAATAVIMGVTAIPAPESIVTMTVDRPFIFAIRDNQTKTILFIGHVTDPTK